MKNDRRKDEIEVTEHQDDPKKIRIGWTIHEIPPGVDARDYWKKHLSPEEFEEWDRINDPARGQETDDADEYRVYHHKSFVANDERSGFKLPVLEFLWGQPWNNLALNYVSSLRPSCMRVANEGATADSHAWRVTIWLEDDNKTIKRIDQEVEVDCRGARNGHDLSLQLRHQKEHGNMDEYKYYNDGICIMNPEAILNLEINENKNE